MEKVNTMSCKVNKLKSVSGDPPVHRVLSFTDPPPFRPMEKAKNQKFEFYFDYCKKPIPMNSK